MPVFQIHGTCEEAHACVIAYAEAIYSHKHSQVHGISHKGNIMCCKNTTFMD